MQKEGHADKVTKKFSSRGRKRKCFEPARRRQCLNPNQQVSREDVAVAGKKALN